MARGHWNQFMFSLLPLHTERSQIQPLSWPVSLITFVPQPLKSGDSWRVNMKFWHTNHHHSNKDSLATAAATQKLEGEGNLVQESASCWNNFNFPLTSESQMSLKYWQNKDKCTMMETVTQTGFLCKWSGWVTATLTGTILYFGWILAWHLWHSMPPEQSTILQKTPCVKNEPRIIWTEDAANRIPHPQRPLTLLFHWGWALVWEVLPWCCSIPWAPLHIPQRALTLPAYLAFAKKKKPKLLPEEPKIISTVKMAS